MWSPTALEITFFEFSKYLQKKKHNICITYRPEHPTDILKQFSKIYEPARVECQEWFVLVRWKPNVLSWNTLLFLVSFAKFTIINRK